VYIYNVAKSLGFSFRQEKNKSKPKALASCADGNEKFPYYRTTLSLDVSQHFDETIQNNSHFIFYDTF